MSNSTFEKLYTGGAYLEKNPLWHTEESSWKAENVMRMVNRHKISARTICEVCCGAGEVLKQLQQRFDDECDFLGCDVSPQAIALCRSRANDKLHFELGDATIISGLKLLQSYASLRRGQPQLASRAPYRVLPITFRACPLCQPVQSFRVVPDKLFRIGHRID
jgi:SAM-dependent methyltransferase